MRSATCSTPAADGDDYRTGVLPDLADPFTRDLFNTYRAAPSPSSGRSTRRCTPTSAAG